MTDDELKTLLSEWKTPAPPATLRAAIFPRTGRPSWRWLWSGSIRVPVPVAASLMVLAGLGAWYRATPAPAPPPRVIVKTERVEVPVMRDRVVTKVVYRERPAARVQMPRISSFHGFEPVEEFRPRIIRRGDGG